LVNLGAWYFPGFGREYHAPRFTKRNVFCFLVFGVNFMSRKGKRKKRYGREHQQGLQGLQGQRQDGQKGSEGKKGRKTVRNNPEWRNRALNAVLVEGLAQAEAETQGVDLTVSMVRGGKTEFPHWQFRDAVTRRVLLHYWPTKGSWYDPGVGERGVYDSWEDALAHAAVRMDGKV
jgi:hypothetical protein